MTRESEFKLKMPGNFNEDNWRRGRGPERRRTVDDRAPWAAKPPTAAISLPLRRIGASGNSAAAAPHHDRGIVRAMAGDEPLRPGPALCGQKMAPRGRTAFDQSRLRH